MFSYDQYCPVAHATEILGDRWTLLIAREMLGGAGGFNELQRGLPGMPGSEAEAAALLDRYLTEARAEAARTAGAELTGPHTGAQD